MTTGVFADEGTWSEPCSWIGTATVGRGATDIGLSGVRLYLDDGTFAVTDADGQYSFYGISPRTHPSGPTHHAAPGTRVVALDHPQGDAAPCGSSTSSAVTCSGPTSRWSGCRSARRIAPRLDRRRVGADRGCHDAPQRAPRTPRRAGAWSRRELVPSERTQVEGTFGPAPPPRGGWRDGSIAAFARSRAEPPERILERWGSRRRHRVRAARGRRSSADTQSLVRARARHARPTAAFVGLGDGDTTSGGRSESQVKGPRGKRLELWVNGAAVPPSRIGRRITMFHRDLGGRVPGCRPGARIQPARARGARSGGVERSRATTR